MEEIEHLIVKLTKDYIPLMNTDIPVIKKGTKGTIVYAYEEPYYEVEFIIDGRSIVETVGKDDIDVKPYVL